MSEVSKFSSAHMKAERQVHGDIQYPHFNQIKHGYDSDNQPFEIEDDVNVAEAMAYAARPLIDEVLSILASKEGYANETSYHRRDDGTRIVSPQDAILDPVDNPAMVTTDGATFTFDNLRDIVHTAYENAGMVQEAMRLYQASPEAMAKLDKKFAHDAMWVKFAREMRSDPDDDESAHPAVDKV